MDCLGALAQWQLAMPVGCYPHACILEPQSRFGDKPVKSQIVCPQNGTALLKGLIVIDSMIDFAPQEVFWDFAFDAIVWTLPSPPRLKLKNPSWWFIFVTIIIILIR